MRFHLPLDDYWEAIFVYESIIFHFATFSLMAREASMRFAALRFSEIM